MSEIKTNEPVKQEGEFKIKKKTPKNLVEKDQIKPIKVDLNKDPNVKKVVIPKQEEDAIQIGEAEKVSVEESS